jgi:hypothetical protein
MIRQTTIQGRRTAAAPPGRAGASTCGPAPYLVLDLGRGRDPHQARCRRCRWRSSWWTTATQAQTEHDRHQLVAHGRGRRGVRGGRRGLVARWVR